MIVFAVAIVAGGTSAFFSDEETSSGNTFTAGAIDLKIDSEQHYNNMVCVEVDDGVYEWQPEDGFTPGDDHYPEEGTSCDGTWEETDLGPTHRFFNFSDVKPGDHGENTISLHVYDNDAYMCAVVNNIQDDDNGTTTPEGLVDDTPGPIGEGELSQEIHFFAWDDDGDNIWEEGEQALFQNATGSVADVLEGAEYALYTPQTGAIQATTTEYLGWYWCYGDVVVDFENNELSCDGSATTNLTQTDSMTADISFRIEQARHNDDFVCGDGEPGEPCSEQNDIMLVLDSSGSIDNNIGTATSAAMSFITSLAPTTTGTMIGLVDFDTTATLDPHLTADESLLAAALAGITAGGSTNLTAAINAATDELANPGDGHDRPDATSPDFMVIITDGQPNNPVTAEAAADAAKADGITIYVLGVGTTPGTATFLENEIASAPSTYFDIADFDDLSDALQSLNMCEQDDPILI